MTKNRFKDNNHTIDFDDPAALTAVPVVHGPVEAEKPVEPVKKPVAKTEKIEEEKPVALKSDLLAGLMQDKAKPKAKSYGFYLDDEVVDALEKLAKQNKSSKSKVLNTLLRSILLEG